MVIPTPRPLERPAPTPAPAAAPVVGWRIWNLVGAHLESLTVDYRWQPGDNRAVCLALGRSACGLPPGRRCQCGFWAVWSPRRCVGRACAGIEPPWQVMGLVAGWGTVALHGREGFRAERATLRCLFVDHPWRCWRPGPSRDDRLLAVAARYGVPLVSLRQAAGIGLLGELGVPEDRIAEAASLSTDDVVRSATPG